MVSNTLLFYWSELHAIENGLLRIFANKTDIINALIFVRTPFTIFFRYKASAKTARSFSMDYVSCSRCFLRDSNPHTHIYVDFSTGLIPIAISIPAKTRDAKL